MVQLEILPQHIRSAPFQIILSRKTFTDPLEGVPAAQEDEAADVFVKGEDCPHGDDAPSEGDAEDVASDHLDAPHNHDSNENREVDVP